MDRLSFIAMSGAQQAELKQAVIANNMANVNTSGFKSELAVMRALPVIGDGMPTRAFARSASPGFDDSLGPLQHTGNANDFAVSGQGYFAVQGTDGQEAYTRAGGFILDANGVMRTPNGMMIQGDAGPITVPPNSQALIGADGTVSAVQLDTVPRVTQTLDRIKLVNVPSKDLQKGPDGLFRRRDGQTAERDESVSIASGALEGSNVNAVDMLTQMITNSRMYDLNTKMIQTADQDDRSATELMTVS